MCISIKTHAKNVQHKNVSVGYSYLKAIIMSFFQCLSDFLFYFFACDLQIIKLRINLYKTFTGGQLAHGTFRSRFEVELRRRVL